MQHYLQSAPLVLLAKVITTNSRARVPAAVSRRRAPNRPSTCGEFYRNGHGGLVLRTQRRRSPSYASAKLRRAPWGLWRFQSRSRDSWRDRRLRPPPPTQKKHATLNRTCEARKSRTPYAETALQKQSESLGCVEALKEVRDGSGTEKDIFTARAFPDPLKISHECDPRGLFQQRELCTPVGKQLWTLGTADKRAP